ncbi:MAG: type IV secretion system DNA-binding domain-containing protein [Candidatus Paceibacterota bacterium]
MSPIILIVLLAVLAIIFIAALVTLGGLRTKGQVERALNMSLFSIRVPREAGDKQKSDKELIGVSEQMLSGFSNLHTKGWNKLIYGEPYISLEIAVHHIGEETHFYISVPKTSEDIIEKQIYSYYPTAEVSKIKDYNIFNPQGASAGAYMRYEKHPILPFKTYQRLESDPMGGILTSMSKLQGEGEGAVLQMLIRPAHAEGQKSLATKVAHHMQSGLSFKDALSKARSKSKEGEKKEEQPRSVTPAESDVIKAITDKTGRQNFDVNLRLITSAPSAARADQMLGDFMGSFVQFSSPDLNGLSPSKVGGKALDKLIYNYSFRLFDNNQAMTMSTEEVVSLYHFPISTANAPRVAFLKAKSSEPPPGLPQEGIIIGKNVFRGQETMVRMAENDRRRHLYVIGQTGTGKTSLMKEMIRQDIESGKGVCIMDPHGEFAEYTLSIVPESRADDVIYFNPADVDYPLGLNVLEIDPGHPEQKTFVINELLSIIDRLYNLKETGGPMFERYFKNALLLLLDDYEGEIPVLADISRILVDDIYRLKKLSHETNPLVKEFWELEAEKAGGEASLANMAPYISSKVDTFVSNEFLRPIINQKTSSFNFRDVIDNQKILVVNLSKGKIGDINANLLGMIIVSKLLMASLARVDMPEDQRKDFYLYMDEFQNFTTESISTILSEARKYRLDLVVAHQFIRQLKDDIRDAVFGNVGSMIAFRVGADDAEFLKNQFEPSFSAQDLMNIDNFNAHAKLLINNQTSRPFNIRTIKEQDGSPQMVSFLKETSRNKFGRPRAEVEAEIKGGRK